MGATDSTTSYVDAAGQRRFNRERIFPREEDDSWRTQAACIGLGDLFFIERGDSARPAKAICAICPVIDDCLDYALANSLKHGIWGGLSERERRRVKTNRRKEAS